MMKITIGKQLKDFELLFFSMLSLSFEFLTRLTTSLLLQQIFPLINILAPTLVRGAFPRHSWSRDSLYLKVTPPTFCINSDAVSILSSVIINLTQSKQLVLFLSKDQPETIVDLGLILFIQYYFRTFQSSYRVFSFFQT